MHFLSNFTPIKPFSLNLTKSKSYFLIYCTMNIYKKSKPRAKRLVSTLGQALKILIIYIFLMREHQKIPSTRRTYEAINIDADENTVVHTTS